MKRVLPTAGLVVVAFWGCGHGATDVESLSPDQVREELVEVLNGTHAFDLAFEDSVPWQCPAGGDVLPYLYYGYRDSPLAMVMEGSLTYEECTSAIQGHHFTVSGDLIVSMAYYVDSLGQIIGADGAATGDLSWRSASEAGACHLDLKVIPAGDSVHVSGAACGGTEDRTFR